MVWYQSLVCRVGFRERWYFSPMAKYSAARIQAPVLGVPPILKPSRNGQYWLPGLVPFWWFPASVLYRSNPQYAPPTAFIKHNSNNLKKWFCQLISAVFVFLLNSLLSGFPFAADWRNNCTFCLQLFEGFVNLLPVDSKCFFNFPCAHGLSIFIHGF